MRSLRDRSLSVLLIFALVIDARGYPGPVPIQRPSLFITQAIIPSILHTEAPFNPEASAANNRDLGSHWTVSTSHLQARTPDDVKEEMGLLRRVLAEVLKELTSPGSGVLPRVVTFSDFHGAIGRMDALLVDAIQRVIPPELIPQDMRQDWLSLKLEPNERLFNRLAAFGISPATLAGKLFLHNLGDLTDRGRHGVRVFQRTRELVEAGLSDVITGNHDFFLLVCVMAFHLPWYREFRLYDYKDDWNETLGTVQSVLDREREESVELQSPFLWAKRLAEHQANQQKLYRKDLDERVGGPFVAGKKRVPEDGMYGRVFEHVSEKHRELWRKLRGFNHENTEIYTGTHAVGLMSVRWWQDLLLQFEQAYADERRDNPDLPIARDWESAIAMMKDDIIPALRKDLQSHLDKGEWWYRVFEAINYKNYDSPEWHAKDWLFHPKWGPWVLAEIRELYGLSEEELNESNYLSHRELPRMAQWYREHFTLYTRDIYQNTYMHAFLPMNDEGEFTFTYKNVEYRGRGDGGHSVWEGLDQMTADVRNPNHSMADLVEAFSLMNDWYADSKTKIKTPQIIAAIQKHGVDRIAYKNGFYRLLTGHVPLVDFPKKLSAEQLRLVHGFQTAAIIIFTDFGAAELYGGLGAAVHTFLDGIGLRGFETKDSTIIVANPRVMSGSTVLMENNPIPREAFLEKRITELRRRISFLERAA